MSSPFSKASATPAQCGGHTKLSDALANDCANINLTGLDETLKSASYSAHSMTSLEITKSTIKIPEYSFFKYLFLDTQKQELSIKLTDVTTDFGILVGPKGPITNPMKAVINGGGGEKFGVMLPQGNSSIEVIGNKAKQVRYGADGMDLTNLTFGNVEVETCDVKIYNPTIDFTWVDDPSAAGIVLTPCRYKKAGRLHIMGMTLKHNPPEKNSINIRFDPSYLVPQEGENEYTIMLFNLDQEKVNFSGKIDNSQTTVHLVTGYCDTAGTKYESKKFAWKFNDQLLNSGFMEVRHWYAEEQYVCAYGRYFQSLSVSQGSQGDQSEAPSPTDSKETPDELIMDEFDEFESLMMTEVGVAKRKVTPGNKESGLSTTAIVVIVVGAVVLVGGIIAGVLLRRGGATEKQKAPAQAAPAAARQPPAAQANAK